MIARALASALLAAAYGLAALAAARLDRLEQPRDPVPRPPAPPAAALGPAPAPDFAGEAFALELEDAVARLERDVAARAHAPVAAATPPATGLAAVYREELRVRVRAGVLAGLAETYERLEREVAPPADRRREVRAALVRVLDRLAQQCADRVAAALEAPSAAAFAGLEPAARAHLRQELARVLGAEEMARFDRGSVFREPEGESR